MWQLEIGILDAAGTVEQQVQIPRDLLSYWPTKEVILEI